jgi:hypothetical protein
MLIRDPEPLTPNHFLLLQCTPNSKDDLIGEELYSPKDWKAMSVMSTHFWRQWLYLDGVQPSPFVENGFLKKRIWLLMMSSWW